MAIIQVPVVNEYPNSINVSFPGNEYSVSFEAANPDGVPSHCAPGGPGVLGSPEYVNLLQRGGQLSGVGQVGYSYEQFTLPQYPNHVFYSFKNNLSGMKDVVAFNASVAAIPTGLSAGTGVINAPTGAVTGAAGKTAVFSTPMLDSVGSTFTWSGNAINAIQSGQGTTALTFKAATGVGSKTLVMTVLNEMGATLVTTSSSISIN